MVTGKPKMTTQILSASDIMRQGQNYKINKKIWDEIEKQNNNGNENTEPESRDITFKLMEGNEPAPYPNISIIVDGVTENTNENGEVVFNLVDGSHTVKVIERTDGVCITGYEQVHITDTSSTQQQIDVSLTKTIEFEFVDKDIKEIIEDAKYWVSYIDTNCNVVISEGEYQTGGSIVDQTRISYTFKVYENIDKSELLDEVTLSPNDTKVTFEVPSPREVSFTVKDMENNPVASAEVIINSMLSGDTDSNGGYTAILFDRTYAIEVIKEVSRDVFIRYNGSITVDSDHTHFDIVLESQEDSGESRDITIFHTDGIYYEPDYDVFVDTVKVGTTDNEGKVIVNLEDGSHSVEVQNSSYIVAYDEIVTGADATEHTLSDNDKEVIVTYVDEDTKEILEDVWFVVERVDRTGYANDAPVSSGGIYYCRQIPYTLRVYGDDNRTTVLYETTLPYDATSVTLEVPSETTETPTEAEQRDITFKLMENGEPLLESNFVVIVDGVTKSTEAGEVVFNLIDGSHTIKVIEREEDYCYTTYEQVHITDANSTQQPIDISLHKTIEFEFVDKDTKEIIEDTQYFVLSIDTNCNAISSENTRHTGSTLNNIPCVSWVFKVYMDSSKSELLDEVTLSPNDTKVTFEVPSASPQPTEAESREVTFRVYYKDDGEQYPVANADLYIDKNTDHEIHKESGSDGECTATVIDGEHEVNIRGLVNTNDSIRFVDDYTGNITVDSKNTVFTIEPPISYTTKFFISKLGFSSAVYGATVSVNGETVEMGENDPYAEFGLPAGTYEYTVTHPGYNTKTGTVIVENPLDDATYEDVELDSIDVYLAVATDNTFETVLKGEGITVYPENKPNENYIDTLNEYGFVEYTSSSKKILSYGTWIVELNYNQNNYRGQFNVVKPENSEYLEIELNLEEDFNVIQ